MIHLLLYCAMSCCLLPESDLPTPRKRALMIVINQFKPDETGKKYPDLGTSKDSVQMYQFFKRQRFDEVEVVYNEKATVGNVRKKLDQFARTTRPGDLSVIYISSHGAHVDALHPKSEKDGQDEIVICYDTPLYPVLKERYRKDRLRSRKEDMLVDDDLGRYLDRMVNRVGKDGHVLFLLDACSSNTATRAPESLLLVKSPLTDEKSDLDGHFETPSEQEGLVAFFAADEGKSAFVFRESGLSAMTYAFLAAAGNASRQGKPVDYKQLGGQMRALIDARLKKYLSEGTPLHSTITVGGTEKAQHQPVFRGYLLRDGVVMPSPGFRLVPSKGATIQIPFYPDTVRAGAVFEFRKGGKTVFKGVLTGYRDESALIAVSDITGDPHEVDWAEIHPVLVRAPRPAFRLAVWPGPFHDKTLQRRIRLAMEREELLEVDSLSAAIILHEKKGKISMQDVRTGRRTEGVPFDQALERLRALARWRLLTDRASLTGHPPVTMSLKRADISCLCNGLPVDKKDTLCEGFRTFRLRSSEGGGFSVRQGYALLDTAGQAILILFNSSPEPLHVQLMEVVAEREARVFLSEESGTGRTNAPRLLRPGEEARILLPAIYPPFGGKSFELIYSREPFDYRPFIRGEIGETQRYLPELFRVSLPVFITPDRKRTRLLP